MIINHLGRLLFVDKALIAYKKEQSAKDYIAANRDDDQLAKNMIDTMMGVVFIKCANKAKYGKLLTTISDQHLFNIDVNPKTLQDAYKLLENYSSASNKKQTNI